LFLDKIKSEGKKLSVGEMHGCGKKKSMQNLVPLQHFSTSGLTFFFSHSEGK